VELGPGRGLFAQDVLAWSQKKFPAFFRALRIVLVETSSALRNRLEEQFASQLDGTVTIAENVESVNFVHQTIVFANEFFDALPVEVLDHRGELRIGFNAAHLAEQFVAPSPEVLEYVDRYSVLPESGERVEAPLIAQKYMTRIAGKLKRGFLIAIDYGYTRAELLAGRHRGTVTAFRRHTMSVSPYEAPGEQDITAHVNFTALRAAGEKSGLEHLALLTQAQFLMGIAEVNQFADAFEDCGSRQEQAKVALQLKHLVTPAGMGETFHVLLMARGVDRDAAMKMGGLRFA
jgi:SAM-dependent MidA family methyltransferase